MKKNSLKKLLSLCMALMLLAALNVSAFATATSMSVAQDIPTSQNVVAGQDLTLHFGVLLTDGTGLTFQWYTNSGPISGANNPTLTAQYYQNVGVYCIAISGSGHSVTSNTCYITVTPASGGVILPDATPTATPTNPPSTGMPTPVITRQPVGVNLAQGQAATLSVEAALQDWSSGAQLRYQWYKSNTNSPSQAAPISNAYSPTYTTSPYDGNAYYLVAVWSSDGVNTSNVVYSNLVAVTYGSPELKITKHPTGETVNVGQSALFIARADNAVKLEWRIVSKDTTRTVPATQAAVYFPGLNVSGEQTESLALTNIPAELDGWSVECKFTGADGKTLYTNGAVIRVNGATPTPSPTPSSYIPGATTSPSPSPSSYIPGSNVLTAPSIGTQPVGAVLSEGETVTLSVGATGADEAKGVKLSYQWYRNEQNSNANGTPISGATSETYVPDTISGSRYYYVAVTASNGNDSKTTYSSPATVTYTAPIATPSPRPSASPSPSPVMDKNPGLFSLIAGPIIAIAVAAIVIGVGVFFLLRSVGKSKDDDYYEDDHYDEYYESRRSGRDGRVERNERMDRDERFERNDRYERSDRAERNDRNDRRGSSRRIDKEYYRDDEFDR